MADEQDITEGVDGGPTDRTMPRPDTASADERMIRRLPFVAAGLYAAAAGLWIYGSDDVLGRMFSDPARLTEMQTAKGWVFVAVTAAVLFALLCRSCGRIRQAYLDLTRERARLDLALTAARGGVWDRDLVAGGLYISPRLRALLGLGDHFPDSVAAWRARIHPADFDRVRGGMTAEATADDAEHHLEYRFLHGDGGWRWLQSRGWILRDERGRPVRMVGITLDVTAQKAAEARITHLTYYDPMTGLPTRQLFEERLAEMLAGHERSGWITSVLRLDIDRFKEVNDELGIERGDEVLCVIAERLRRACGPAGVVARLAADEFAIAMPELTGAAEAEAFAERALSGLGTPLEMDGTILRLHASVGVALHPEAGAGVAELMKAADIALDEARREGGNGMWRYEPRMQETFTSRVRITRELRMAIERRGLDVDYQPIVGVADGRIHGFEALVRWRHPELGTVPPDEFVPIAERAGLVHEIDLFVLEAACCEATRWKRPGVPPMVSVNLSPRHLAREKMADQVAAILRETGLEPERLQIEITETALTNDYDAVAHRLEMLCGLGVRITIDDFGTGYSSLLALRRLPIQKLKIDKAFIAGLVDDTDDAAIVGTTLKLAAGLGLEVVAEGVETAGQLEKLRAWGCHQAQGYLFSRPRPATEIPALLDREGRRSA